MTSRRPRTRPRPALLAAAVCLVAVSAGVATLIAHASATPPAPAKALPLGTATVHEGDLVETQSYQGQLSYASRGSAQLSGAGTVTSLPRVGRILTEDGSVARVDDQPIGVLFGRSALYRRLGSTDTAHTQLAVQTAQAGVLTEQAALTQARTPHGTAAHSEAATASTAQAQVNLDGAEETLAQAQNALRQAQTPEHGADVALVARDMVELGYLREPTDSWSSALQDAVQEWQDRTGAAATGDIAPSDVLVLPGPSRVSGVQGEAGDTPTAVTITLSSPSRDATFQIKNGVPAGLTPGRRVKLTAANRSATGRVTGITTVKGTSTVTVAFDPAASLARSHATRVTMTVTLADQRNVLTVPTQALLALASGGDALQLPQGRLLAVRTGAVQHGDIEISGPGIHAGLTVVSVA